MAETQTVSFLKQNAAKLQLDEPMIITQNGQPVYVVEKFEDRKRRDDAIALMKLVSFSRQDIERERVMSSSTLRERLAAKRK